MGGWKGLWLRCRVPAKFMVKSCLCSYFSVLCRKLEYNKKTLEKSNVSQPCPNFSSCTSFTVTFESWCWSIQISPLNETGFPASCVSLDAFLIPWELSQKGPVQRGAFSCSLIQSSLFCSCLLLLNPQQWLMVWAWSYETAFSKFPLYHSLCLLWRRFISFNTDWISHCHTASTNVWIHTGFFSVTKVGISLMCTL